MKEKIQQLLDEYILSKQEAEFLLKELYKVKENKLSIEDRIALENTKIRTTEEIAWRGVFIDRLENIILKGNGFRDKIKQLENDN